MIRLTNKILRVYKSLKTYFFLQYKIEWLGLIKRIKSHCNLLRYFNTLVSLDEVNYCDFRCQKSKMFAYASPRPSPKAHKDKWMKRAAFTLPSLGTKLQRIPIILFTVIVSSWFNRDDSILADWNTLDKMILNRLSLENSIGNIKEPGSFELNPVEIS